VLDGSESDGELGSAKDSTTSPKGGLGDMLVFIDWMGDLEELFVSRQTSAKELRDLIASAPEAPAEHKQLIFRGILLDDRMVLFDFGFPLPPFSYTGKLPLLRTQPGMFLVLKALAFSAGCATGRWSILFWTTSHGVAALSLSALQVKSAFYLCGARSTPPSGTSKRRSLCSRGSRRRRTSAWSSLGASSRTSTRCASTTSRSHQCCSSFRTRREHRARRAPAPRHRPAGCLHRLVTRCCAVQHSMHALLRKVH
jgi:hypothetical protein